VELGEFEHWVSGCSPVRSDTAAERSSGGAGERSAGDATGQFDLVCAAQAWHWLDPETRFARAAALLRPGGWLARWWNRPAPDPNPLRVAIDRCYERFAPTLGAHFMAPEGPPDDAGAPAGSGFEAQLERRYPWSRTFTTAEWLDLLRTQSDHRLLGEDRRERLLRVIGDTIEAAGGSYEHHYVCWLFADRRSHHDVTGE